MALNAYLRLKGQRAGDIRGGVTQRGREGRIAVIGAMHDIVSPRDASTGMATSRRSHKPYVITKELDQASPLLYSALANNETFTEWELQFFSPRAAAGSAAGVEAQTYTVRLTNASIASIAFRMPNNKHPDTAALAEYEEIAFVYQKIDWIWVTPNITATDSM